MLHIQTVKKIKRLLKSGNVNQSELARDVGVTPATISFIKSGKIYSDVEPKLPRHRTLNPVLVRKIKRILRKGGVSQSVIARDFGVTPAAISQIKTGRIYADVKLPRRKRAKAA